MDDKAFLNRIREILDQTSSKFIKPEANPLITRKSGTLTESDLRRLLDFADKLDSFMDNDPKVKGPIHP